MQIKFEKISIKALMLWEIMTAVALAALVLLIVVIFLPYTWLWYSLLWVVGASYVLTAFWYLPTAYVNVEYGVNSKVIVYRKGVFFPNTQVLYRDRIAFVTVYDNPLTHILHINSLVISAAGGDMRILFMNSKRAKQIADMLSRGVVSHEI